MSVSPSNFDEAYYLSAWPDVQRAVSQGSFSSAHQHWSAYGRAEGRAYRILNQPKVLGSRMPGQESFAENLGAYADWPANEYCHRGVTVRCCLEEAVRERILEVAATIHDGLIVEIGVYGGATLLHLAEVTQKNRTRVIGIDPWESVVSEQRRAKDPAAADYFRYASQLQWNIRHSLSILQYDHIQLLTDLSLSAAQKIKASSIDFLIVDGDHSEKAVQGDLVTWWPKLKQGGMLWGDDYHMPGVRAAADAFAAEHGLDLEIWRNQFFARKQEN